MTACPDCRATRHADREARRQHWARIELVLARLGAAERTPAGLTSKIMEGICREPSLVGLEDPHPTPRGPTPFARPTTGASATRVP